MATNEKAVLEFVIKATDNASVTFNKINDAVDKSLGAILNLKSGIASLGVGIALNEIISQFAQFDDVMRAAGAVTGATAQEFAAMTELAMKMGSETAFTASQSAEALYALGAAGFTASQQITALPGVLQLAAAAQMDLGRAAEITTGVLTSYRFGVEEIGRVNDVMGKASVISTASIEDMGTAFTYVGSVAAAVGTDFEDLNANLAALHNNGINGSMAGTTLRGVLDALVNPTQQEAELMSKLSERIGGAGLQIFDTENKFVGFTEIVKQLENAQLTAAESMKLFGQRAGPGMAALLGVGSGKLSEMTTALKDSGGTAARIAAEMEAGLGGTIRSLQSAYEGLKISLGESISEAAGAFFKALTEDIKATIQWVQQLKESGTISEWADKIIESLIKTKTYIEGLIAGLTGLINTIPGVSTTLGAMARQFIDIAPAIITVVTALTAYKAVMGTLTPVINLVNTALQQQFTKDLLANITEHVTATQAVSKAQGVLAASTQSLNGFLTTVGASLAAFGVGWSIGKLIDEMKLFGDGTVTVSQRVQELFDKMLGGTDQNIKNIDVLLVSLGKFKDVKIVPEEALNASAEAFKTMNAEVNKGVLYWETYIRKLEMQAETVKNTEGISSSAYKLIQENIKQATDRLTEMNATQENLTGIEKRREAYDVVLSAQKAYIEEVKAGMQTEIEMARLTANSKEEFAIKEVGFRKIAQDKINAEYGAGSEKQFQLTADLAKKKLDIIDAALQEEIKKYEASGLSKASIEAMTIKATEDANKQKLSVIEEAEALSLKAVTEAVFKEVEVKKKSVEETLHAYELETQAKQAEYDKQLALLDAASVNELTTKTELNKEKERLEAAYTEQAGAGVSTLIMRLRNLYEEDVRSLADAEMRKLELKEQFTQDELSRTSEYLIALQKRYEEEIQAKLNQSQVLTEAEKETQEKLISEIQKANEQKLSLETELITNQTAISKQRIQTEEEIEAARVQAITSGYAAIQAALQQETDMRSAELSKQIAEIELQEAQGIISHQAAIDAKKQAEMEFAQYRLSQADAGVQAAINAYGTDSKEYLSAVKDKINAEAEFAKAKIATIEAINQVVDAEQRAADRLRELGESVRQGISYTAETVKQLADAFNTDYVLNLDVDTAKVKLGEIDHLTGEILNNLDVMARGKAWTSSTMQDVENLKELEKQFQALQAAAREAGLTIDMTGMTIDEATEALKDAGSVYVDLYEKGEEQLEMLKDEWDEYRDKIQEINDEIAGITKSADEYIRDLKRQSMTEEELWYDKKLEYEETIAAAATAASQGSYEEAAKLYEEAMKLAENLAIEVKDAEGNVITTLEENTNAAIELISAAQGAAVNALNEYQDELASGQDRVSDSIDKSKNKLDELAEKASNIPGINIDITATASEKKPFTDKINELIGLTETFTRNIGSAEMNVAIMSDAFGETRPFGDVLTDIDGTFSRFKDTMETNIKMKIDVKDAETALEKISKKIKESGATQTVLDIVSKYKLHSGGKVPGSGETTATLLGQEFVMPIASVKTYGDSLFEALRLRLIPPDITRQWRELRAPMSGAMPSGRYDFNLKINGEHGLHGYTDSDNAAHMARMLRRQGKMR